MKVGIAAAVILAILTGSCVPAMLARGEVTRLEREARALANTSGCSDAAQCRSAPAGAKSCGGPRYFLAYCPLATDTVALYRKLAELNLAEREYNKGSGMASDCAVEMPPRLMLASGECRMIDQ